MCEEDPDVAGTGTARAKWNDTTPIPACIRTYDYATVRSI